MSPDDLGNKPRPISKITTNSRFDNDMSINAKRLGPESHFK